MGGDATRAARPHMHGPDGVRFYTKLKTVTARWPSSAHGAGFTMPTMK